MALSLIHISSVTDEQMDAVRLMSIHKSKGLEFPIVFVCGMSKRFNRQDSMGAVVLHPELGVGIDSVDPVSYTHLDGNRLRVSMGKVSFYSDEIPVIGERREAVSYTHLDVYKRQVSIRYPV